MKTENRQSCLLTFLKEKGRLKDGNRDKNTSEGPRPPLPSERLAEGWTVTRLAKEARISRNVATDLLRTASNRSKQSIGSELDREGNRAVVVARQVRDAQIEQTGRMEALTARALSDLEAKAIKGELSVRDLETLVKLREKHWAHVKELSGLGFAEKMHLAQAKGEATGKGLRRSTPRRDHRRLQ